MALEKLLEKNEEQRKQLKQLEALGNCPNPKIKNFIYFRSIIFYFIIFIYYLLKKKLKNKYITTGFIEIISSQSCYHTGQMSFYTKPNSELTLEEVAGIAKFAKTQAQGAQVEITTL